MPSDTADRNDAMVRGFLAAWERRDTEHIMFLTSVASRLQRCDCLVVAYRTR